MREKIDRDIEDYVILAHVMVAVPEHDELAPVADARLPIGRVQRVGSSR